MTDAVVYADGSGLATGGPAGVGFLAIVDGGLVPLEGSLQLPAATNQQAEILAAAFALKELPVCEAVLLYSDSRYVVDGWDWLPGWIAKGWRTTTGAVANQAHWERLQVAVARHQQVEFRWVRGHDGTPGNERADELAGAARLAAVESVSASATKGGD